MKKKVLGIVAASAFAIAALGAPVAADQGGVPNENACSGVVTSYFASGFGGLHLGQSGLDEPGQGFKLIVDYVYSL